MNTAPEWLSEILPGCETQENWAPRLELVEISRDISDVPRTSHG